MENRNKKRNILLFTILAIINLSVLIEFLLNRNNTKEYYNITTYFINYQNGFVSRGVIGTLFSLIPDEKFLMSVQIVAGICVVIFTCFLMIQIFTVFKSRMKENTCYWFLFMMTSSTVIHFMFRHSHTKMDLFWYMLFIPILLSFQDFKKHRNIKICFLFLFSIICTLIHQAFIFVLVPFILILLWDSKEKNLLLPYLLVVGATFIVCQFFGKGNFDLILEAVHDKISKVFPFVEDEVWLHASRMLSLEYQMSVTEHFIYLLQEFLEVNGFIFLMIFAFNFINILVLGKMFKTTYKEKAKRYLGFLLLSQLPLYALTIDYDRWFTLFLLNLQFLVIHKLKKGESVQLEEPSKLMDILFVINTIAVLFLQYQFGVKIKKI